MYKRNKKMYKNTKESFDVISRFYSFYASCQLKSPDNFLRYRKKRNKSLRSNKTRKDVRNAAARR